MSADIAILPVLSEPRMVERLLRPIDGRSSLARTLDCALAELPGRQVAVTTDDEGVKAAVRALGLPVTVHDRSVRDYVPALAAVVAELSPAASIVVVLEPTHPFRPAGLVARSAAALAARPHLDSVVAVRRLKANLWSIDESGAIEALTEGGSARDPEYYQELVGLALATRPALLARGRRLGDAVGFEVVPPFWGLVDIRDEVSLAVAGAVAGRLKEIAA
ncbi:MAG: hypothetical protein OHK0024_34220 [Thalassobaculales bacterium]